MRGFVYQAGFVLLLIFLLLSSVPASLPAENGGASAPHKVTFREYLEAVEKHSLDLQNQRENITSARAGVAIAGVRPDPLLTTGIASKELNAANKPSASTATTVGLAITLETAGKRGRRISAAQDSVKLTEANVGAFLHDLELQSAAAFVEACRTREALERKQSSLKAFQEVVRANLRR
jgi:outer membrane protein, heavy metal efflux system